MITLVCDVTIAAMGQTIAPQAVCCRPDAGDENRRAEITLWEDGSNPSDLPLFRAPGGRRPEDSEAIVGPDDWDCCRTHEEPSDVVSTMATSLESLTYSPVRFDTSSTVDAERSHSRYSKIVVHSTRARTQRRSKTWEEWLRAAASGRTVTLLMGFQDPLDKGTDDTASLDPPRKITAMYHLDRALSKITIVPADPDSGESAIPPITILVNEIQVICPITDFMLLTDTAEAQLVLTRLLDEGEKARAALLQFKAEGDEQKRVCFLEESESAKDRFVQALTALWLEKRNDHSMWF